MNGPASDPDAAARPPRRDGSRPRRVAPWTRAAVVLLVAVCVLAVAATALYLNRRTLAREVLTGWLARQGVAARVTVERLERDGFIGTLSMGDPADPDFQARRVEVDYALSMPWSRDGFGVRPGRIRLVGPRLKAGWRDGRLTFGALDPLIETFTRRPAGPATGQPVILIEQGRLNLAMEAGTLDLLADARLAEGRLMQLSARTDGMASLHAPQGRVQALDGRLTLETDANGQVELALQATARALTLAGIEGRGAALTLQARLPYPQGSDLALDGPLSLTAAFGFDRIETSGEGATALDETTGRLKAEGRLAGPAMRLRFNGATAAEISGPAWTLAETRLERPRLVLVDSRLDIDLSGQAARVTLAGPLTLTAQGLETGDLLLRDIRSNLALRWASHAGRSDWTLRGGARAGAGRWPLLGQATADDVPELAAMKIALADFSLDAPGLAFASTTGGLRLDLSRPAIIRPRNGGELHIEASGVPVLVLADGQAPGGGVRLDARRGQGLPEAQVVVFDWRLTPGGFRADFDGRVALDFGLARGLELAGGARMESRPGALTLNAPACMTVTAARLEMDENDVLDLATSLCPPVSGPLVRVTPEGWRVDGRLAGGSGQAPFLGSRVEALAGQLTATGRAEGLGLDIAVASATVIDATDPIRFLPLSATGRASMTGEDWTGGFDLSHPNRALDQTRGQPLAHVELRHSGAEKAGGVTIHTDELAFAEHGLQPSHLTPLAADWLGEPVTGRVRFTGYLDWSGDTSASGGELALSDLGFSGPVGRIEGLDGVIAFDSLVPASTAPGQRLTARSLEVAGGISELDVTFDLDEAALTVTGAGLSVAGGRMTVEPFSIPFDPALAWNGTVRVDHVQLGDIIAGAGFGDKVQLDAVVSGRIPFTRDPQGRITVSGGLLEAVQPGRLSIRREALTGLEAGGGGEDIPPGAVEDLAYQAMEHLAFDSLTVRVDSLDHGRVNLLFRIIGRHDPPERRDLRLGLWDLVRNRFLQDSIPLPSDTGIRLTLDTVFNLDEIIGDLMALNRARRGEGVPDQDATD